MQEALKQAAEQERQEMMGGEEMMMRPGYAADAAEAEDPADPQVLAVATMLGSPGFQKR